MKCGVRALICVLSYTALTIGARALVNDAADSSNPYGTIVERNVFDLKPPPPPSTNTDTPPAPPPNVKLTGITSILGNMRALFMVASAPEPGKPPGKEVSVILAEGQREGSLEVLEIHQKEGTVKINNDGQVATITFDTKPPTGSAPGPAAPGVPPMMQTAMPRAPMFAPPQATPAPLTALPTREVRTDPGQQAGLGLQALQSPQPNQPSTSPEEQMVMMEIERERTKDAVAQGVYPPLPPTPATAILNPSNPQAAAGANEDGGAPPPPSMGEAVTPGSLTPPPPPGPGPVYTGSLRPR